MIRRIESGKTGGVSVARIGRFERSPTDGGATATQPLLGFSGLSRA